MVMSKTWRRSKSDVAFSCTTRNWGTLMPMALSNNWLNKKNHKMSAVISYRAREVNKKFSTKHKNIYEYLYCRTSCCFLQNHLITFHFLKINHFNNSWFLSNKYKPSVCKIKVHLWNRQVLYLQGIGIYKPSDCFQIHPPVQNKKIYRVKHRCLLYQGSW